MTVRVRNWHKFQHFKDRRPPWVKLYRELLDDPDWHSLDGNSAKALVMIWLIASESDGVLPDIRKLSFRMRVTEKAAKQLLNDLSHWLEQDDIAPISDRYHDDTPETEGETETEGEAAREVALAAPPSNPKRKKQATQLPIDFQPDWTKADAAGLSRDRHHREFEKFKNHAQQNARVCVNWQAAWANWCLKATDFAPPAQRTPGGIPGII